MKPCYTLLTSVFVFAITFSFGQVIRQDSSFGLDGIVKNEYRPYPNDQNISVFAQSNKKIVITALHAWGYTQAEFVMVRYDSAGKMDTTFGLNGLVNLKIDSPGAYISTTALQNDDKIVVSGTDQKFHVVIARFNTNGSIDSSFGKNGVVVNRFRVGYLTPKIKIQPDNKILVGFQSDTDFYILRYRADGGIDQTFGIGGMISSPFKNFAANVQRFDLNLQSTGKIILTICQDSASNLQVRRFNENGSLDSTFGTMGIWHFFSITPKGENENHLISLSGVLANDKIEIVTQFEASVYVNPTFNFVIKRINSNGSLDSSFEHSGTDSINLKGLGGNLTAISVNKDGSTDLAGINTFPEYGVYIRFMVVHLNSIGNLDSTFGSDGIALHQTSGGYGAYSMAVLKNAQIALGGNLTYGGSGIDNIADLAIVMLGPKGSLDSLFGVNGIASIAVNDPTAMIGKNMVIQPDSRIVVECKAQNMNEFIYRINNDGTLDSGFGTNGKITIQSFGSTVSSILLQPDGKLIIGGYSGSGGDRELRRYNANGSSDGSFLTNGFYPYYSIEAIALQPDGKIIVAGGNEADDQELVVQRLNPDGRRDSSFGTNGVVIYPETVFTGQNYENVSIALQPDSKILLAPASISKYFEILRLNSNGSIDSGFNMNGRKSELMQDPKKYAGCLSVRILLQPDGKIVQVGESGYEYGTTYNINIAMARYEPNGMTDSSFGVNGESVTQVSKGSVNDINNSILQPDGKILVVGGNSIGGNTRKSALHLIFARFDSNGGLDSSFGEFGFIPSSTNTFFEYEGYAVSLQSDGKLVVSGGSSPDMIVARYLNDLTLGVINFSSQNNSALIYPNPIHQSATLKYTLTENENMTINLVDVSGKVVKTFIAGQNQTKGNYTEQLNFDSAIPAGNYFLVISNGRQKETVKVIKQ